MARRGDDEADAPWLAEVDEEPRGSTSLPRSRLLWGVLIFAGLLAAIVGGLWAITTGQREGGSSGVVAASADDVPLITADPGPYKVRPADPGGMQIDGAGDTMYAAGEGAEIGGAIDPGGLPEDPLPRAGEAPGPEDLLPGDGAADGASAQAVIPPAGTPRAPVAAPVVPVPRLPPPPVVAAAAPLKPLAKPVVPAPGTPAVKATGSAVLQLGAFSSSAKADATWKEMSGRFSYLAGLSKNVVKVERDGQTLYRLRAGGVADRTAAADLCARLKVAGEDCLVAP